MVSDTFFPAMALKWEQAFQDAKALGLYQAGSYELRDVDFDLLARAHRALVNEEDPDQYLAQLSSRAFDAAEAIAS